MENKVNIVDVYNDIERQLNGVNENLTKTRDNYDQSLESINNKKAELERTIKELENQKKALLGAETYEKSEIRGEDIAKQKEEIASLFLGEDVITKEKSSLEIPSDDSLNSLNSINNGYLAQLSEKLRLLFQQKDIPATSLQITSIAKDSIKAKRKSITNSTVPNRREYTNIKKRAVIVASAASILLACPFVTKKVVEYRNNVNINKEYGLGLGNTVNNGMIGDAYYNEHKLDENIVFDYGSYNNYESINYGVIMESIGRVHSDPSDALFMAYCSLDGYGKEPEKTNMGINYFNKEFGTNYKSVEDFMILNEYQNVKEWKAAVGKKMISEVTKNGESQIRG